MLRTRPKRAWAHAQSREQPRHRRGRWEMINYIYHLPSAAGDTEYLQWLIFVHLPACVQLLTIVHMLPMQKIQLTEYKRDGNIIF